MQDPLANIVVGMTGEAEVVVTPEITVGGHVPGMPMVYGTPFMILLMEIASGRAIKAAFAGRFRFGRHARGRAPSRADAARSPGRRDVAGDREDAHKCAVCS